MLVGEAIQQAAQTITDSGEVELVRQHKDIWEAQEENSPEGFTVKVEGKDGAVRVNYKQLWIVLTTVGVGLGKIHRQPIWVLVASWK